MKKLLLLIVCFISIKAYAQVTKPDKISTPAGTNTQVYTNSKLITVILPHYNKAHQPSKQDTIGDVFLNTDTSDLHLYIRIKMGTGAGAVIPIAMLKDIGSGGGGGGSYVNKGDSTGSALNTYATRTALLDSLKSNSITFTRRFKIVSGAIDINTDSAATNLNNFILAKNQNGDIIQTNMRLDRSTNTLDLNGIVLKVYAGMLSNFPLKTHRSFLIAQDSLNHQAVIDTNQYPTMQKIVTYSNARYANRDSVLTFGHFDYNDGIDWYFSSGAVSITSTVATTIAYDHGGPDRKTISLTGGDGIPVYDGYSDIGFLYPETSDYSMYGKQYNGWLANWGVVKDALDSLHSVISAGTIGMAGNADSLGHHPASYYQIAGNYITSITGDITATGPGAAAATLATVNSNVGTYGSASNVPVVVFNAKGLATAITNTPIQITESQVTSLVTDLAAKQATLVSGTNIKTINGNPVTGSGNITVQTPLTAGTDYEVPLTFSLGINRVGNAVKQDTAYTHGLIQPQISTLASRIVTANTNIATNASNISGEITRATSAEALKLNISDTAAMPYVHINGAETIKGPKTLSQPLTLTAQSITPATPASTTQLIYANAAGALTIMGSNGFPLSFSKGAYTAGHTVYFPDVTDTLINAARFRLLSGDVSVNTSNIATNTSNITTNAANTSTNTTNITTLQGQHTSDYTAIGLKQPRLLSTYVLGTNVAVANTDSVSQAFGKVQAEINTTNTALLTYAPLSSNLSVFASTTSAQLAGVLSDETGTGLVVYNNTPTLITPVIGVATATSIGQATATNALISLNTTGVNITRNVADANAALMVNQQNVSSTGAVQTWQFGGVTKANMDITGTLGVAGFKAVTGGNNIQFQLLSTGANINRNIADANPVAIFNQVNTSSTGDIADFQAAGVTKLAITNTAGATFTSSFTATANNQTQSALTVNMAENDGAFTGVLHLGLNVIFGTSQFSVSDIKGAGEIELHGGVPSTSNYFLRQSAGAASVVFNDPNSSGILLFRINDATKLQIASTGILTLSTAPTTATGVQDFLVRNTSSGDIQKYAGSSISFTRATPTITSATSLAFAIGTDYVFNGTTATYTSPTVATFTAGNGNRSTFLNRGSGNITFNSNAGGSDFYKSGAVSTFTLTPGSYCTLESDGTFIFYH